MIAGASTIATFIRAPLIDRAGQGAQRALEDGHASDPTDDIAPGDSETFAYRRTQPTCGDAVTA